MNAGRRAIGSFGLLLSPGLLLALATLLLNDFVLKPLFGNAVTGKLSDFAGLFAFPLFWSALAPRWRLPIHAGTALGFVVWKSPWSQPLIDAWNAAVPLTLGRTVDPTDLIALPVIGAAFLYAKRLRSTERPRGGRLRALGVGAVAIVAFSATSYRTPFSYEETYAFTVPPAVLLGALDSLRLRPWEASNRLPGRVEMDIPTDVCFGAIEASLDVRDAPGGARLSVGRLVHRCSKERGDSTRLLYVLERCIIARLDSVLASSGRDTASRDTASRDTAGGQPERPALARLGVRHPPACTEPRNRPVITGASVARDSSGVR